MREETPDWFESENDRAFWDWAFRQEIMSHESSVPDLIWNMDYEDLVAYDAWLESHLGF